MASKIIGIISGNGRLIGHETDADVSYEIITSQEQIVIDTMDGTNVIPGLESMTARLRFSRPTPALTAETFTLLLNDGRELTLFQKRWGEFIATGGLH